MPARSIATWIAAATLSLALVACAPVEAPPAAPPTPTPQVATTTPTLEALGPDEVVTAFYDWYLTYPGNAIADGAYRDSPYLTGYLVERLDVMRADGLRADPLVCAQDLPAEIVLSLVAVEGNLARVYVHTNWPDHGFDVELIREDAWRIDNVVCGRDADESAGQPPVIGPATADGAVIAFYDWYLKESGAVLAEGRYADSELLAPEFVARIDALRAEGLRADPFVCAQDLPEHVTILDMTVEDGTAAVLVETSFGGGHGFTVELRRDGDLWLIADIDCAARPQ